MTENVFFHSKNFSADSSSETFSQINQSEVKELDINSDCDVFQLQICNTYSLENTLLCNQFSRGFSKIDEEDEDEEVDQCHSEVKKNYCEYNNDEDSLNQNAKISNMNIFLNNNDSLNIKKKFGKNQLKNDKFQKDTKQVGKQQKNEKDDMVDESLFIVRNLDTGEIYDLRKSDIENKLYQQYCSLVLKTTTSQTQDSSQYNNLETEIFKNDQNWNSYWIKVKKNNNLLIDYCENGDLNKLKSLLDKSSKIPTQINFKSIDNWTGLHFASSIGNYQIVELLLSCGADPFSQSSMLRTPLHSAVINGNIKCVQFLVDKGGKILMNMQDMEFNTPLHLATQNDYLQIVEYLILNGVDYQIKNHKNLTPYELCTSQEMKQLFHDYNATNMASDQCYARLTVGGLVKRNNRADQVTKILLMTQNIQKCAEQNRLKLIQEKQKLLKEMSWRDFRFIKKLGQGSFGEVYLVEKDKKLFAMKIQNKQQIIQKNLQRYVQTEKKALSLFNHPFIIKLHYAFQNQSYLFMVMDFAEGGDMGKYLNKRNKLTEDEARIYTAQIILALEELHRQDIIYRDLKPDNVVLDSFGNAKLTDFGLSKEGIKENTLTKSFCGSIAYLAPEILAKRPHSRTVDWYLLGTFLYELLVGVPPYYDNKKEILYENIKKGPLKIPKSMSFESKDLIKKLLNRNPRERLGSKSDSQEIKAHPFFKDINWDDVYKGKTKAPLLDIPPQNTLLTISVNFDPKAPNIQTTIVNITNNIKNEIDQHDHIDKWSYIN